MENTQPTEPIVETIAPESNQENNSVIRSMREQLEAATRAKKDLEAQFNEIQSKLKEKEDAELSELEKLKRSVEELSPHASAAQKYQAKLEAIYQAELEAVPEDKREMVALLSSTGDLTDRLDALRAAKGLITSSAPAPAPATPVGVHVAPGRKVEATPAAVPIDVRNLRWNDVFNRAG